MIVPSITRGEQARILDVLMRTTHLSEQAVTAAFIDADRGRLIVLDPLKAIRQDAYRASAHGLKEAERMRTSTTGQQVAATLASTHRLSPEVGGMILGAAIGLRLGLEVRLTRTRKKNARPKLAVPVARFNPQEGEAESDLEAARRWARDMGRVARKSGRARVRHR